ncbi:MAG: ATP-binding protein [Polyangiaceae bacterium]
MTEIADEIKTVYENARRYMHNLKSSNHETALSVTGFLKEIQQKFTEKGLMKVSLRIDEEDIRASLSPLQHNQLYHIMKEAVSNIIKHSNAGAICISISMDRFNCHFSIADDGKGFSKDHVVHGIGINSMRNRVKELDGTLDIACSENGTSIKGHFPI